ncbi:hypothetical protein DIPPA_33926 [Diplonema papillatum]|nr:hypothetical protein DIPPA_33926 [Diplonema papillatum]
MPTHPVCPAAGGPPKSRSGGSREQRQPAGARGFARADEADRQQKPAAGDCHQAAAPPPPPPPPPHGQGEGDAGRAGELPARPGAVEGPQVPSDGRKKTKDEAARLRSGGDDGEAKRVGRRSKLESFPSKARSCSAQPVSASADDSSARIASASPSAVPRFKLLKKSRFSSSFKSPARSASADAAAGPVAGSEYRKGERVDIFYDNGWFPATIRRKRPDDHGYDIRYLTGELSFSVLPQYMRKGRGPEVPAAGPAARRAEARAEGVAVAGGGRRMLSVPVAEGAHARRILPRRPHSNPPHTRGLGEHSPAASANDTYYHYYYYVCRLSTQIVLCIKFKLLRLLHSCKLFTFLRSKAANRNPTERKRNLPPAPRYLTGELSFSVLPQYMRKGRGPEVPAAGPPAGAPPHGAQKRARKASPSPAAGGGCSPSPSPKGHTRKLSPAGAKARFAPDPPSAAA